MVQHEFGDERGCFGGERGLGRSAEGAQPEFIEIGTEGHSHILTTGGKAVATRHSSNRHSHDTFSHIDINGTNNPVLEPMRLMSLGSGPAHSE
jgi:hypothetical protein